MKKTLAILIIIFVVLLGLDFIRESIIRPAYKTRGYFVPHFIVITEGNHLFLPFPLLNQGSLSSGGRECGFLPPGSLNQAVKNYESNLSLPQKFARFWFASGTDMCDYLSPNYIGICMSVIFWILVIYGASRIALTRRIAPDPITHQVR